MGDTGMSRSPKLEKGALVQLVPALVGVVPTIVAFQYNPASLSRDVKPWAPTDVDDAQRGGPAPDTQPFPPQETFTLTLELDATDDLEDGSSVAATVGVADRIAALRALMSPSNGIVGDLLVSARALSTSFRQVVRPTIPTTLFVWGPGRILPVRVTSLQVQESLHSPTLYPLQATVSLTLDVITPDQFASPSSVGARIAIAAYGATRTQEDALALLRVAKDVAEIRALLPF